jgi:hypothetical protein
MLNKNELLVCKRINTVLNILASGQFICKERKTRGHSSIDKPADLGIYRLDDPKKCFIAVEVAAVNTTQLTGEVTRLYFDLCKRKLLVLKGKHPGKKGRTLCEKIFCLLFRLQTINQTSARVVWYSNKKAIKICLKDLIKS